MTENEQAFILRIAPSGIDRVKEALNSNQIIIGWSEARELLDPKLDWNTFREIVRKRYYKNESNLRRAGAASGHMWRFIREMQEGNLVVVPYGSSFYVARITGRATYDPSKVLEDTAYRRNVNWLNNKTSIPRSFARSALQSRMKTQGTCAYASDLLTEIKDCLAIAARGESRTFESDLQDRLVRETLEEIRTGRMDSFGFENLIKSVLLKRGAKEVKIVPRSIDKGVDILATFLVAGVFRQLIAVQAKHYHPEPPVGANVVKQLIQGIEAESADLGMVVTSGDISEDAVKLAEEYYVDNGIKIELVNGEQFASLIVEYGIRAS